MDTQNRSLSNYQIRDLSGLSQDEIRQAMQLIGELAGEAAGQVEIRVPAASLAVIHQAMQVMYGSLRANAAARLPVDG